MGTAIEGTYSNMPRPGRPRKNPLIYTFKELVEYTSDSENDTYRVLNNRMHEVVRDRSPRRDTRQRPRQTDQQQRVDDIELQPHQTDQQQRVDDIELQHHQVDQEQHQQQRMDEIEQQMQQQQRVDDIADQQQQQRMDEIEHQVDQIDQEVDEIQQQHRDIELRAHRTVNQQEEIDEWSENDGEDFNIDVEDYSTILEKLKSKWLLTEINHSVSKTASDAFWKIGLLFFNELHAAPGRRKKTPQFKTVRRQMYRNLVPEIELEIGYRHKVSGEITVVKDSITPMKRFSTATFEKIYEIGTVKVNFFFKKNYYLHFPTTSMP